MVLEGIQATSVRAFNANIALFDVIKSHWFLDGSQGPRSLANRCMELTCPIGDHIHYSD